MTLASSISHFTPTDAPVAVSDELLVLREEARRLARKLHYAEEKIQAMERDKAQAETMFEFSEACAAAILRRVL